jgi:DNA-binding transcriptional LysR family regulator
VTVTPRSRINLNLLAVFEAIFVRTGNALAPTALARAIIEPVRDALRRVEIAVDSATRFDPGGSDRAFRIGLRQSAEIRIYPEIVARARAEAPAVRLESVNFHRAELEDALARGDLDLVIDIANNGVQGLKSEVLWSDTLLVALRPGHPALSRPFDLAAYLACEHVIATPRPGGGGAEDTILAGMGLERRIVARCQHVWSAWRLAATSDLVLTIQRSNAETLKAIADLELAPLPLPAERRELVLYRHEASERDPGIIWLRGLVRDLFADR